jgi:hypothetical protein
MKLSGFFVFWTNFHQKTGKKAQKKPVFYENRPSNHILNFTP